MYLIFRSNRPAGDGFIRQNCLTVSKLACCVKVNKKWSLLGSWFGLEHVTVCVEFLAVLF